MKKKFFLISLSAFMLMNVPAQTVSSPDGRLKVDVEVVNGCATYAVTYGDDVFVEPSPLGVNTTIGDFTRDVSLRGVSDVRMVTDDYALRQAKKSRVHYEANEVTCSFNDKEGRWAYDVTFRVDNNNVAFKYRILPKGDRISCLVKNESTGFVIPEGSTTFLCPQMLPQSGWMRTCPSYETHYAYDEPMGKNGNGLGYALPALFKIGDKGWAMICETGVSGSYCASRLDCKGGNEYVIAYPHPDEFGGVGTSAPGLALPGDTPWRTVTVGVTLAPIAETTVMWDLVKPLYEAKQEYKYGRATWSWIIRQDGSCNYAEQREYIDFAADMGYEYVLIDALWDKNIGYERMEELVAYAKSKNVGIFLWYNSNGYWNDAPQGPKHKLHTVIGRRKEMKWLESIGVKGLKIDFIGSDKQQTMQMYEDILADANEHGLMVIFHGCTLPRGWERMYPNFVSSEAVRASENLNFSQHENDIEATFGTIHPVLRNSVAAMDFGGSALNRFYSKSNTRGNQRKTSEVYAITTAVLYQGAVQNFAIAPNNMTDAPAWAMEFMKNVPTTWDDVKFIDGYPGKYIIFARRHGDTWYIGAVNAQKEPFKKKILLPMLKGGSEITVYSDDKELVGSVQKKKLPKNKKFEINVPYNGGMLIVGK